MQNVDSAKPKWHWALLPAGVVIFARPPRARPACTHSGTRSHSRVTIFERTVQHPPAHVPRAPRLDCWWDGLLSTGIGAAWVQGVILTGLIAELCIRIGATARSLGCGHKTLEAHHHTVNRPFGASALARIDPPVLSKTDPGILI